MHKSLLLRKLYVQKFKETSIAALGKLALYNH